MSESAQPNSYVPRPSSSGWAVSVGSVMRGSSRPCLQMRQWVGRSWKSLRDERRADAVAVGDGRQPLDVRAEQLGEDLGLRLAELRELLGDMSDRAVVLAELLADRCAARRSSVPVRAQGLGQGFGALLGGGGLHGLAVRGRPARRSWRGRRRRPPRPRRTARCDPAQGVRGELVVGLVEGVAAAVGEREDLRGAAARARAVDPLLAGLHDVVGDQCVEVAAHGGGGQPQPPGQLGDGRRAVVQDGPRDPVAGGPLTGRELLLGGPRGGLPSLADVFHNAIVA